MLTCDVFVYMYYMCAAQINARQIRRWGLITPNKECVTIFGQRRLLNTVFGQSECATHAFVRQMINWFVHYLFYIEENEINTSEL